jgi:hypothetical protein
MLDSMIIHLELLRFGWVMIVAMRITANDRDIPTPESLLCL